MIKFVVFDFDGTMVNSMDLALRLYNDLARTYKVRVLSDEDVHVFKTLSTAERYKFVGAPFYLLPILIYRFRRNYTKHVHTIAGVDGVRELLFDLKRRGYSLSIVSSNSVGNIRQYLQRAKLDVFDRIFSSRGIRGKYAALRKAAKFFKAKPENMIYIGDEILDIEACRKAGMPIIAVGWGFESIAHLASFDPDFLVHKPEQIMSIVGGDRPFNFVEAGDECRA